MKKTAILLISLICFTACSDDTSYSGSSMTTSIPEIVSKEETKDYNNNDLSVYTPEDDYVWPDYETVEITEKMFVGQINDIYINYEDYKDKYIKYEGQFTVLPDGNSNYKLVIRYGPGCCADDGMVGFQIFYDGDYPDKNDWVEVIGIVEEYDVFGYPAYILHVKEITVKDEQGKLAVTS